MAARKKPSNKARLGEIPAALQHKYEFQTKIHSNRAKQPLARSIILKDGKPTGIPDAFTYRPVMLAMELVDLDTREEFWRVSWYRKDGSVQSVNVERETAKSATKLGKLDAYGLPSKPKKLDKLVEFLSDVEAEAEIARGYVTDHFGWQRNVPGVIERWFLWGETALADDDDSPPPLFAESRHSPQQMHEFTFACHAKGTFEAWKEAVATVEPFPAPVAALVAALASPLLRVFHANPFILDLAYRTSSGKTITLYVAGSTTGQPDYRDNRGSIAQTMNSASTVGFEVVSEVLGALPVLVDDSKTAKNRALIQDFIYQQSAGKGRLRGTPEGGVRRTHTWLNVCITTGEAPLKSHTEAGGAAVRVLSWDEAPFGAPSEETGRLVTRLHDAVMANYGHALPALVQYALDHQDAWEGWRDALVEEEARLLAMVDGASEATRRQSEAMAVLSVTGRIAYEADVLPFDPMDALGEFWLSISGSSREDLDKPRKAMQALRSWVDANRGQIYDTREHEVPAESNGSGPSVVYDGSGPFQDYHRPNGWKGYLTDEFLAFPPETMKAILKDLDYNASELLRSWLDEGWLKTNRSEPTKPARKWRVPGAGRAGSGGRYVCVLLDATDDLDE